VVGGAVVVVVVVGGAVVVVVVVGGAVVVVVGGPSSGQAPFTGTTSLGWF